MSGNAISKGVTVTVLKKRPKIQFSDAEGGSATPSRNGLKALSPGNLGTYRHEPELVKLFPDSSHPNNHHDRS